jgi:hypothetical protein
VPGPRLLITRGRAKLKGPSINSLALSPSLTKRPQKWRIPVSVNDALNFMIACETREPLAFVLEIVSVVRGASS